jgi:hypothetical protein
MQDILVLPGQGSQCQQDAEVLHYAVLGLARHVRADRPFATIVSGMARSPCSMFGSGLGSYRCARSEGLETVEAVEFGVVVRLVDGNLDDEWDALGVGDDCGLQRRTKLTG